jgi:hypothetical protein
MTSSISRQKHYRTAEMDYEKLGPVSKKQRVATYEEKLPLDKRLSLYRIRLIADPCSKEKDATSQRDGTSTLLSLLFVALSQI